jgi:hypothetical protein
MLCELGAPLAERFAIAARKLSEAAVRVGGSTVQQFDYARLIDEATAALREAVAAYTALAQHIHEHQCGTVAAPPPKPKVRGAT